MSRPHSKTVPLTSPNVSVKRARVGTLASVLTQGPPLGASVYLCPHFVIVRGGLKQFNILSLISPFARPICKNRIK